MRINSLKSIKLWWKFEGRYIHNNIQAGIKNLIKWFPVIWKDRDWDHTYIWYVLKFKLEQQAKCIGGYDRHVSAQRDAEIISTCVRLIDKIMEDFYVHEYFDYHELSHSFDDIENSENKILNTKLISENYDDYFAKYPLVYKRILASEEPFFSNTTKTNIAMNMCQCNQERAEKLLFKILQENIGKWWT